MASATLTTPRNRVSSACPPDCQPPIVSTADGRAPFSALPVAGLHMTVLFSDPVFLLHETGQHPERPQRLVAIGKRLAQSGLAQRCQPGRIQPLTASQAGRVHVP